MIKKYFLFLILLIVLLFSTVALLLYGDYNKKKDEVSNRVESILSVESQKLTFALDNVRVDVKYLEGKFRTHDNKDVINDFINFSTQKKRYDQIRFLDINGMERLRIDYNNGDVVSVAENRLQNKKNRYYFLNSIEIERNSIYISPLDLNVEHGQIEVPIKPVIRFATPVYNHKNEKIGVVIINYLAVDILDRLKQVRNNFIGDISLLNSDGYYFIAKDSSDEWGFMFPNKSNLTFKYKNEKIWKYVNSKNIGKIENENGIYFFRTINLNKSFKDTTGINCANCTWKMIVHIPNSYLNEELLNNIFRYLPLTTLITVILSVLLWILLVNLQKRKTQEEEIKDLHKQIINERDIFVAGPTIVFKLKNAYGWPVEYVSKNVENILGYSSDDFLDNKLNYASIILPQYIHRFSESVALAKKNKTKWFESEPYEVVRKDGKHIWLNNSVFLIRDKNDNVTHLYGYVIDITALKDAQRMVEENSRYIKTVVDTIADPTVVIDIKTYEVILYNKAAKELYIGKQDIPSSIKCHQLSHSRTTPCDGEDDICPINQILLTKAKTRVTHKHYKEDGSVIFVELIAIPIFDNDGNVVQIIESHRDISHHLETENALKELASTDKLTQTYNRVKFDEILEKSFISAKNNLNYFGLIMFDIDHFKNINDTYGHDVGDSVLIEITDIVKKLIRKHDILVRWGGEEFIIYIPDSDGNALQNISEHLRQGIEQYNFKHLDKQLTSSFGATMLRDDDTVESLIKRVDSALYNSKNNGRNISTLL